jgi:hypothetical protein
MNAPAKVPTSMWEDEKRHPWRSALMYLVVLFGTMLVTHLCARSAHAEPGLTIGLHLATQHLEHSEQRLNTATPGLYLRTGAGFTAGVFRNSYSRTSAYAGWTWQTTDRRFALTAGVLSGYSAAKAMPLISPSVRFDLAGITARLAYIPKPLKQGHSSGLHLGIEQEF